MKKFSGLLFILTLFASVAVAQVPPLKMGYQTVVRNASNELVTNALVGIRISILEDNINGGAVYMETHSVSTNANGLATLEIGNGTPLLAATLADVDWEHHDFFVKAEIDPQGGNSYSIVGAQQLITVPYSFFAGKAAYADSSDFNNLKNRPAGTHTGDLLYWDASDSLWHTVPVGSAGQVLTLNPNGIPQWYSTVFNQNTPPTIVTDTIFDVTGYTMSVKCSIVNSGSTGIIASGVCWSSTNPSPSIGNNYTSDGSSVGNFTSSVAGLVSNTTYYVCAYATNNAGTSYGNVLMVKTPTHCGTVSDIDGNAYNTVYIGRQCWLKENLRTTHYADAMPIDAAVNYCQNSGVDDHNHLDNGHCYYYPNNDPSVVGDRGLLYSWGAVMRTAGSSSANPSGILGPCPYGWHVPSSAEWCELENMLNPGIDVNCSNFNWRGTMAKSLSKPMYWDANSTNTFFPGYWLTSALDFNTTDFSMIPAGIFRKSTGYNNYYSCSYGSSWHNHIWYPYYGLTSDAFFWTTETGIYRHFSYNQSGSYYGTSEASTTAMSVRCLKDYN